MKKQFLLAMPLLAVLILAGCGKTPYSPTDTVTSTVDGQMENNASNESPMDGEFMVNINESIIRWEGARKIGGGHNGTIALSSGSLTMEEGKLKGGNFVINMDSIKNEDLSGEPAETLVGHLKSDDFFDVATYPEATFVIKEVTDSEASDFIVTGDLTMKGNTNEINFPVTLRQQNGAWVGNGVVEIDRTRWNVRYGSDKFFKGLGDNIINDIMTLEIELVTQ